MARRVLLTTLAVMVAAVAFAALLLLGPEVQQAGPERPTSIPDAPYVPLNAADGPGASAGAGGGDALSQVGSASQYYIQRQTGDGRRVEFMGDTYTPLPAGESLIGQPVARIELGDHRIVEIRADEGRLVEQDRQPQHGTLTGHVRVTLYEGSSQRPARFGPDSPDATLRVYLDAPVRFDLLAGRLDSDGPVHVTSRRFDLRGHGLTLRYNELAERIEYLELRRGDQLRLRSGRADESTARKANASEQRAAGKPGAADGVEESDGSEEREALYRAQFERLEEIQRQDLVLTGDTLDVFFSLANAAASNAGMGRGVDDGGRRPSSSSADAAAPRLTRRALAWAPTSPTSLAAGVAMLAIGQTGPVPLLIPPSPTTDALADEAMTTPRPPRDMLRPREDDIVVTWTGRLLVEPADLPGEGWARDDVMLRLTGRPMRVIDGGRELATAAVGEYRTAEGQINLVGRRELPVLLESPSLGLLECEQMRVSATTASATFWGPGRFLARGQLTGGGYPLAGGAARTSGIQASWTDRMEATFYTDSDTSSDTSSDTDPDTRLAAGIGPEGASNDLSRLRALRQAELIGQAEANHPAARLSGQTIAIRLAEPTGDRPQAIESLHVTGTGDNGRMAHVRSRDPQPRNTWDVRARDVLLQWTGEQTAQTPSQLIATGKAVLLSDTTRLLAQTVRIAFQEVPPSGARDAAAGAAPGTGRLNRGATADDTAGRSRSVAPSNDAGAALAKRARPRASDDVAPQGAGSPNTASMMSASSAELLVTSDLLGPPPQATDGDGLRESEAAATAYDVQDAQDAQDAQFDGTSASTATAGRHTNKPSTGEREADVPRPAMAVRHLEADGHVTVELHDQGLVLLGDRLKADQPARQAELFGTDQSPARAIAAAQVLSGQHLVIDEATGRLHVVGPGTLAIHDLGATGLVMSTPQSDPKAGERGRPLEVAWHQAMHYDHAAGQANFAGHVKMTTGSAADHTQLTCEYLTLDLVEVGDGSRAVRAATARGAGDASTVVFLNQRTSASMASGSSAAGVTSRLRLTGPVLTFDNVLEQVQVLGAGSLLVEDYGDGQDGDTDTAPQVAMRGRGATLLTWNGQMTLDAQHNDLRAVRDVAMDHVPPQALHAPEPDEGSAPLSSAPVSSTHLTCQRLLADLEPTGGLSGWLSSDPPQPEIRGIYADREVRVIAGGRTYLTDHMAYTGVDRTVVLRGDADGRGLTEIHEGDGRSLTARQVRWDLNRNTYELVRPGPTRMRLR